MLFILNIIRLNKNKNPIKFETESQAFRTHITSETITPKPKKPNKQGVYEWFYLKHHYSIITQYLNQ